MSTWVALLRGINVGGKHKLPMKGLVALLQELGPKDIKTYIQSGNVVFRASAAVSAGLEARLGSAIEASYGFRPAVLLVKGADFERIAAANPFPAAQDEASGRALSVFFLGARAGQFERAAFEQVQHPSESWALVGRAFYLHAPEGFHASKLAAKVERTLGVPATARNWRTVSALLELITELS